MRRTGYLFPKGKECEVVSLTVDLYRKSFCKPISLVTLINWDHSMTLALTVSFVLGTLQAGWMQREAGPDSRRLQKERTGMREG